MIMLNSIAIIYDCMYIYLHLNINRAYVDLVTINESDRDDTSPPTSPISISSNESNQ